MLSVHLLLKAFMFYTYNREIKITRTEASLKAITKCLLFSLIACSIFSTGVSGNMQKLEKQHNPDILREAAKNQLNLYQSKVEQEDKTVRGNLGWGREYWYRLNAERGYSGAQYHLGLMYARGEEVPKDYKEALKWFRLSAEQGDPDAQYFVGLSYEFGEGISEDDEEAVKWYLLGAEQGHTESQSRLGGMYLKGAGVPEDRKEAVKWFLPAAGQGDKFAQISLGWAYDRGEGVPEDDEKSMKWYRLAADQGSAYAQNSLADLLLDNNPSENDAMDAKRYFKLAIENGLKGGSAETSLGLYHFTGAYEPAIPVDYEQAFYWSELAAEAGSAAAHCNMALHYFSGLGAAQSFEKMVHHLIVSAELIIYEGNRVTDEPDEWLPYKSLAPADYWIARELWLKAESTKDGSYIDKLRSLKAR